MWIETGWIYGGCAGQCRGPASIGANQMGSFGITRTGERARENRGRKALHEALKEMVECTQSTEGAHAATEFLLADQGRDDAAWQTWQVASFCPFK
jgi:hypothetical protein